MTLQAIIRQLPPEFDYLTLMHALSGFQKPRDKVTHLLKQGVIQRVKKGIYVKGPDYGDVPYSPELLSNLIYGPSYVSLEWALQYYGFIPEQVHMITAVTLGSSKRFQTPVGYFTYHHVPTSGYNQGYERISIDDKRSFLMATPEKALVDLIKRSHGVQIRKLADLEAFLLEDLRILPEDLVTLRWKRIIRYAELFQSYKLEILQKYFRVIGQSMVTHQ